MRTVLDKMVKQYHEGKCTILELKKYVNKINTHGVYEITHMDEVEELKIQFSRFFRQGTNNSDLIVPSKYDNIYNLDEIQQSTKKELIIKNLLARKVIMINGEEASKNFMHRRYQDLNLQWQRIKNNLGRQLSLNAMALRQLKI